MVARISAVAVAVSFFVGSVSAVPDGFSLVPDTSCGARANCYEGPAHDLARIMQLDPLACKRSVVRPGSCEDYAFLALQRRSIFLPAVTVYQVNTTANHLWFNLVNVLIPGGLARPRCGEFDAAQLMPDDIFKPSNKVALAAYTVATVAAGYQAGRCADIQRGPASGGYPANFTEYVGSSSSYPWAGTGFDDLCQNRCGCKVQGTWGPGSSVCRETPSNCACQDVPDDPPKGEFCSLCGPRYTGLATIKFFQSPPPPTPAPTPAPPVPPQCNPDAPGGCNVCSACCKSFIAPSQCATCVHTQCGDGQTIAQLATATADLSTLVAALKAGDLVDTLNSPGPFTVFAPTNEAFAALPAGVVANLLKPQNKAQLVDILTYHVVAGSLHAKDLTDGQMITTVEGKSLTVRIAGRSVFINSAKVTAADNDASNGVVHIIDSVLMP